MLEYLNPANAIAAISGFLQAGGPVVVVLMCSTFLMWVLISERFFYFTLVEPRLAGKRQQDWNARTRQSSWIDHNLRERLISEVKIENERYLGVIKALIVVTPLLGLLGTVTGMIEVFQVMVSADTANARLMASGISKATIPTMTGLAVSLTGVFSINILQRWNLLSVGKISDHLEIEHGKWFATGRRLTSSKLDEAEVNITPLLDIVFILLIFFIVTATFLQEIGIGLISPEDTPPEELRRPPPTLVLSVRNDGFVMVDDARMVDPRSVKPIIEAFKAEKPQGVVLLNAAPDARTETTVLVLDQARMAGVDPAIAIQARRR